MSLAIAYPGPRQIGYRHAPPRLNSDGILERQHRQIRGRSVALRRRMTPFAALAVAWRAWSPDFPSSGFAELGSSTALVLTRCWGPGRSRPGSECVPVRGYRAVLDGTTGEVRLAPGQPRLDLTLRPSDSGGVAEGTAVSGFFAERMPGRRPEDYLIRVNRLPAPPDLVLKDGDRVSVTPTKIEGASRAR